MKTMGCFLCLEDKLIDRMLVVSTSAGDTNCRISDVINMHLGLSLKHDRRSGAERICRDCWCILSEFHRFYELILKKHGITKDSGTHDFQYKTNVEPVDDRSEDISKMNKVPPESDVFLREVKVEVEKLTRLPQVQIIENNEEMAETELVATYQSLDFATKFSENVYQKEEITFDDPKELLDIDCQSSVSLSNTDGNIDNSCSNSYSSESSHDEYAVIPKRVVVRPKKYKKRGKTQSAPVRLSPNELMRRKEQQQQFDSIIVDFFGGKLLCPVCGLFVINFSDMLRHHRTAHKIDPGYIICCGRKFSQRKALAEHVLVHRNPEHFKCKTCSKVLKNSRLLATHEQTHLQSIETKKTIFQCDKCPKSFSGKSTFDYHILSKHVPKTELKFTCPICNKKLLTERKLQNHMKCSHDPERVIICEKCGKQMRSNHSLKKHLALMHSMQPRPEPILMQCKVCDVWLKNESGLKQHIKSIHTESAGEHRCEICGKVSPNARALRRHVYHNHECERKFKCTMCEKAFKRPQELREHTSTHTGEVLYTCANCSMTFFCSANLYKHRQRLHKEQYEADKKQPRPPNILQQAVGATAALKIKFKKVH